MTGAAVLAGLFVLYAMFASRLERLWISAPMVFVVAGTVFGTYGLNLVRDPLNFEPVRAVTEVTLALLLFADASTISLHEVEADGGVPTRLLLIGLPLTMVLGTLVGMALFPSAGWAAMALIAVILAPTDAALGLAVVTNPVVPVRVRRVLNVESGLNDGIATPFVTWLLAVVAADEHVGPGNWALHAFEEIGLAILVAVAVGIGGGRLIAGARRRGWTSATSEQLAVLAFAFLAYEGALAIEGNGFVAAFVAGILFGATTRHRFHEATEFTETLSMFMSFLVWTVFGAGFVGPVLSNGLQVKPLVYAVLSLTVVRMLPVAASLRGVGLQRDTVGFIGWFGPRGLASVVFTLLAFTTLREHGVGADTILQVATYTILLSVIAHGLSATPFANWYGRRAERAEADHAEYRDAPEPRVRRQSLAR